MSLVRIEPCPLCGHDSTAPIVIGFDRTFQDPHPLATLATALHDAARLAIAADACNALIVHRVPRGEEGRRDLVTISAYTEQGFALRAAERKIARLQRQLAGIDTDEGEFAPDLEEAANR